ncbi:MAG: flagellar protein FlaG, partial [Syntrophomonas sp.]|nr:flagellar protein FlaG [Syntrophomonas sp.]
MRVDGQGMATDYIPAKNEAVSRPVVEQKTLEEKNTSDGKTKVGLEALNTAKKASIEDIQGAIDEVNQAMKVSNYHLEFKLFEDSDVYQVKVVDSQSSEVIKE